MSSSSENSADDGGDGGGLGGGGGGRGRGDYEGPSSSRRRAVNEVWPEPFLEALATHVAIDASHSFGRLAAAAALANVFQVCSTWRAVSGSDLLWQQITPLIWNRTNLRHNTWRDEYIFCHRTAQNFQNRRSSHTLLRFDPSEIEDPDGLICRCLTLSDLHLACGFADGTVRLFDLTTRLHISTFRPHHRNGLGRFSRAVSGIVINNLHLAFASMDGDIHVAIINGRNHARRAHLGDVYNDGALVNFTGCGRWWVGLFAGVPSRAFHIWDGLSEELVFVGGTLTDPVAVEGWQMLTELTESVGRVVVTSQESALACTRTRLIVFDLRNHGIVLGEEEIFRRELIVSSVDVSNTAYISVDNRGLGSVRRVDTLEEVCRFNVRGAERRRIIGCMNSGCVLICAEGVIRAWGVGQGEYMYRFRERMGEVNAMVANDTHVAAAGSDTTIHLWDFGAR